MEGEVRFYQHLAEEIAEHTVYCYDAGYATHPARYHLLLADLSETHTHTQWPLPPTPGQLEQAIDCLAGIHARWWEHPRFAQDVPRRYNQTAPSLTVWVKEWEQQLTKYLDFLGDRLSAQRRAIYEWVLPRVVPLLLERYQGGRHFTLTHQDAHHYNFLFPHNPDTDVTRLVDWSTWDVDLGGRDLAYLIALFFFPEQRTHMEQPLLRRYHNGLVMRGVRNYDWDCLWYDYRLSVISNLFIPVGQFVSGTPARVWWLHAERSFLAFEDLKCAELLT
jgi:thiamine kinase-like enzyme